MPSWKHWVAMPKYQLGPVLINLCFHCQAWAPGTSGKFISMWKSRNETYWRRMVFCRSGVWNGAGLLPHAFNSILPDGRRPIVRHSLCSNIVPFNLSSCRLWDRQSSKATQRRSVHRSYGSWAGKVAGKLHVEPRSTTFNPTQFYFTKKCGQADCGVQDHISLVLLGFSSPVLNLLLDLFQILRSSI